MILATFDVIGGVIFVSCALSLLLRDRTDAIGRSAARMPVRPVLYVMGASLLYFVVQRALEL